MENNPDRAHLRFEISVYNADAMHEADGWDQALQQLTGFRLAKKFLLLDPFQQLPTLE